MARAHRYEPTRAVRAARGRMDDDDPRFDPLASANGKRNRSDPPAWAVRGMRNRALRRFVTFVLAIIGLALVILVSGVRVANQDVGYVGVVRNGGPFDTRDIRQILMPGQSLTWTGFYSSKPHEYPSAG